MKNKKSVDFLKSLYEFAKIVDALSKYDNVSKTEMQIFTTINLLKNEKKEQVTTSKISKFLDMSKPAISQILKSMEEKDYIKRDVCKENRRITLVDFTEKGKKVFDEHICMFLEHCEKVFAQMENKNIDSFIKTLNEFTKISTSIYKN